MSEIKLFIRPDEGWTQRYEIVKELADCYLAIEDYQQAEKYRQQAEELERYIQESQLSEFNKQDTLLVK